MEVGAMPREQITHNRIVDQTVSSMTYGTIEEDIPTVTAHIEIPRRNLHIAWHPADAGWVQVGIDITVAELRDMLAHAEAEAQSEARRLAEMGEYAVDAHQFRVMSDVLSRSEVNATVRTLRTARDRAYGRDE
jgi:hypothetical protein